MGNFDMALFMEKEHILLELGQKNSVKNILEIGGQANFMVKAFIFSGMAPKKKAFGKTVFLRTPVQ